ncbi:MAG: hypothetical protein AB9903_12515 [Vulcanimicrobiota bacterium]
MKGTCAFWQAIYRFLPSRILPWKTVPGCLSPFFLMDSTSFVESLAFHQGYGQLLCWLFLQGKYTKPAPTHPARKPPTAGLKIIKKFIPSLLPGGPGFQKISNAVQGIPNSNFEAPQNPAMASLEALTPFRPVGIDQQQSQIFKKAQENFIRQQYPRRYQQMMQAGK